MKRLTATLSLLALSVACAGDTTEPVLEELGDDPELATEVYEIARDAEIEATAMSTDKRRAAILVQLTSAGVMTDVEAKAIGSIFSGQRAAADVGVSLRNNVPELSAVVAMTFAAVEDAVATRPDLTPESVVATAMRAASRGAHVGVAAGGKRGASFGAITAVHNTLVSLIAN